MEAILSVFDELRSTFRIVDAIDILLVSTFLYAMLLWFQQAGSRRILISLALLAVVYFVARVFDMYLTSFAFQTTFAVLLFILVVVFQEDLRRILERASDLSSVNFGHSMEDSSTLDTIVESVFKMAASKTGALLVLRGKEPLERHLNGGIPLHGIVSASLLYSIFDPHSPGHDGAVVIDRGQITQFASHLPISKDTKAIAGRGTRHSAALGLSECSDALTIVVSEERGVVSVAQSGSIVEMQTASELKEHIGSFLATTFPSTSQSQWQQFIVQHGRLKLLSFVIAVSAWFTFAYDPHSVQRTFVTPVEYRNLSKELELAGSAPNEARITLSGTERDFRFLDPGSLKISLNLAGIKAGYQEIAVNDSNLRLPSNVELYRVEPRIIRLEVQSRQPAVEPPNAE